MMTTVLLLLQTTNCSTFLGRRCILCTVMSLPLVPPSDLNVFEHSVLLTFHTFIEPSELALKKSTDQEFMYIYQFLIHVLHFHFISVLSSSIILLHNLIDVDCVWNHSVTIKSMAGRIFSEIIITWSNCVHHEWIQHHLQKMCDLWTLWESYQTLTHGFWNWQNIHI